MFITVTHCTKTSSKESVHKIVCMPCSDARLVCTNKLVNVKNKPEIGNLTKKQALHASSKKIQQNKKSGGKLHGKAGRHTRKNKPKMSKFSQKHAKITFSSKLKQQKSQKI